jgi:hypothetical protein
MSRTQWVVVFHGHTTTPSAKSVVMFHGFLSNSSRKTFGVAPWGEELLAVELIHALTRREELSFIPQTQKIFFVGVQFAIPLARHSRDANNVQCSATTLLPTTLTLLRTTRLTGFARKVRRADKLLPQRR